MNQQFHRHYGFGRVQSSLKHFLLGKAATVFASVLVLIILARELSVGEFAALVLLQALVNFVSLLSSFGVSQTTLRYVPVLRSRGDNAPMYRIVFWSLPSRAIVVAALLLAVLFLQQPLKQWLDLGIWQSLLPLYLVVGWLRLMIFYVQRLLESLLWQKASQYSLAVAALLKLALVVALALSDRLGLLEVIVVEMIAEAVAASIVLAALIVGWRHDPERDRGDRDWPSRNRKRMFRYGVWSYLQTLAGALYGTAPNRLLVSRFLTVQDLGLFGFISAVSDLVRRYLPTGMLQGLIRPLFFAKYEATDDFSTLVEMGDVTFRISLALLLLPTVFLATAGEPFINWLTASKYGDGAYILVAIFGVLALESYRSQLELLVQSTEKAHLLLIGNLILSVSLLSALPLLPVLNIWAIVIANAFGNILTILWVVASLYREGFRIAINLRLLLRMALGALVALTFGALISRIQIPFFLTGLGAMAVFCMMLLVVSPFSRPEREKFVLLVRGFRRRRRGERDQDVG
jgi:O-antigen/teichoic acid export membrane protein